MKNIQSQEIAFLRNRAEEIARRTGILPVEAGKLTAEGRSRFLSGMQQIMRENRTTGAVIVLVRGKETEIVPVGMSRLLPPSPAVDKTCFRMASITKLAVTFGFLSLMEEDLLSLDTDVSEILGFSLRNPRFPKQTVTARMLMTHTSGITDYGGYAAVRPEHPEPLAELLSREDCWRSDAPGESFHYSNLGAGVTGVLMETAARLPLSEIMRRRVFDPLGIRATLDPRRVSPASDLADGYRIPRIPFLPPLRVYNAARLSTRPEEPFAPEKDYYAAVGRLIADGSGAAGLLRLLLSKQDSKVLSLTSLQEMRALQDGRCGVRNAGRGLNVAFLPGVFPGRTLIGHQGVAYGMCAELFGDPDTGDGAVILTNSMALHKRRGPFIAGGFDLLALAFAALAS